MRGRGRNVERDVLVAATTQQVGNEMRAALGYDLMTREIVPRGNLFDVLPTRAFRVRSSVYT
ncbi:hypothetical protein OsJ_35583 [Oryza sativa Japonica Group]|uniref:Uncharacterized protein n=2 Tax=Oryza sativa subsp. japonica TaxID=39947 RepID=A0A8J8XGV6_ORYSJ|nr:hypothetical protein LOC_Os12g10920 [Oryza sativa Japonica Group]EEE52949.1 hypothetical protein OsJ_35583 [Oryza sativa Japonica Group]